MAKICAEEAEPKVERVLFRGEGAGKTLPKRLKILGNPQLETKRTGLGQER